jgi:MFS family permease
VSIAVLLYTMHNLVAVASVGRVADRGSKMRVLVVGYGFGVVTNLLLAVGGGALGWLVAALVLSGVYISVEETLEKAVATEFLPRELRRSVGCHSREDRFCGVPQPSPWLPRPCSKPGGSQASRSASPTGT